MPRLLRRPLASLLLAPAAFALVRLLGRLVRYDVDVDLALSMSDVEPALHPGSAA